MFVCAVLVAVCLLTLGWAAEIVGCVVKEGDMVGVDLQRMERGVDGEEEMI